MSDPLHEKKYRQQSVALLARAKINLSLCIAGKRSDGYHELSGLVAFADFGDRLSFEPFGTGEPPAETPDVQFELAGPFAAELATASQCADDNLVLTALHLYEQHTDFSLSGRLCLTKNLPIASGIGGGSSDAATALNLLQEMNDDPLAPQTLRQIALQLGADVPMCLMPAAQWVSSIGETCQPVPDFPALACVLVNPHVNVPTGAIFNQLNAPVLSADNKTKMPDLTSFTNAKSVLDWLTTQRNDLQAPAIATAPIIADVLKAISQDKNCVLARMSGSGATCFGLYGNEAEAGEAARRMAAGYPEWWVVAAKLS
ncbi:MAG: 4-(cytidine 5'-diphospho)-2-C-methyl-D-erythritol kinase [Hyphomicrobiaceae bacterium]|nr:4-(cytidine 5'-diphospho)-2-C-methyl-D-erythritol kinase [Hyphomicrobiaceae bacterium]